MLPRHSNPSSRIAHAPYNFVPLPEQVIRADYKIPGHDRYAERTGYLDCNLTTLTPTYTRAVLSPEFLARWNDDKPGMMRDAQARETYAQFFSLDDAQRPIIPGSSLRGMIRALIEIVGYGKMAWVGNDPKITFRAVAAARNDPLKPLYDQVLGKFGRKVRAGYLLKKHDEWLVQPALLTGDCGWPGQDAYLKVKDRLISSIAIPGFMSFNNPNYRPQYHEVSFDARVCYGKRGNYIAVTNIGPLSSAFPNKGILVCSGNMLETGKAGQPSPRTHHAIVLSQNPNAEPIKIRKQSVENYLNGLTSFQKEPPFDSQMGCLSDGRPIFYVEHDGEVVAFGHSPNFRIPYWLDHSMQAAAQLDFVPKELRSSASKESDYINRVTDIAEAIFGFAAEGKKAKGLAGRVFFTDAIIEPEQGDIWLEGGIITPKILGNPKPTTFQHYLVQDRKMGHDPDDKGKLAHYGTPTPEETIIRGHKLYWHKQEGLGVEDFCETEEPNWESDTQHTQVKPVSAGIEFRFRVCFENLKDMELGALVWVLDLPEGHHHKIGMGKPLGLGSVAIKPRLVLTDRLIRYNHLLDENAWSTGEREENDLEQFKQAFEQYILDHQSIGQEESDNVDNMAEIPRIKMLLEMLRWPGPKESLTEYMKIEPENEYKDRPVLPDALNLENTASANPQTAKNTNSKKTSDDRKKSSPFRSEDLAHIDSGSNRNVAKTNEGYNRSGIDISEYPKSPGLKWLDELAKAKGMRVEDLANSSKVLAESWKEIEDLKLKDDVFKEIKLIYQKMKWWDNAPARNTRGIISNYYKTWEEEKR